jgi:hypothetical protein
MFSERYLIALFVSSSVTVIAWPLYSASQTALMYLMNIKNGNVPDNDCSKVKSSIFSASLGKANNIAQSSNDHILFTLFGMNRYHENDYSTQELRN